MKTRTTASSYAVETVASNPRRHDRRLHGLRDAVADIAVTTVWAVKFLAWIVVAGCATTGAAAMGLPETPSWPTQPRLIRTRRATTTLLTEIDRALS